MEDGNKVPPNGERFGTSPVSDAYFKFMRPIEEDQMVRDMLISGACKFTEEVPFEEFEGIGIDMSGSQPIYSKGWREFFKREPT